MICPQAKRMKSTLSTGRTVHTNTISTSYILGMSKWHFGFVILCKLVWAACQNFFTFLRLETKIWTKSNNFGFTGVRYRVEFDLAAPPYTPVRPNEVLTAFPVSPSHRLTVSRADFWCIEPTKDESLSLSQSKQNVTFSVWMRGSRMSERCSLQLHNTIVGNTEFLSLGKYWMRVIIG